MFLCEYCKIFKKTYFEEHLQTTAILIRLILETNFGEGSLNIEALYHQIHHLIKPSSPENVCHAFIW